MTGWDFLDRFMYAFPPIATTVLFVAVLVIFIVGFSKHGLNFLKYGFKQGEINSLGTKIDDLCSDINMKIDGLRSEVNIKIDDLRSDVNVKIDDLRSEISGVNARFDGLQAEFRSELATIKTNHFGHLKGFLTELTGILLDKDIINNTDKARLDNQLRDM